MTVPDEIQNQSTAQLTTKRMAVHMKAHRAASPPPPPTVPWMCSQCTLENVPGASVCAACAGPGPVPPPAPRVEASASMDPMQQALDRLAQGPSFGSTPSFDRGADVSFAISVAKETIADEDAEPDATQPWLLHSRDNGRLSPCLQLFLLCASAGFVAISAIPWLNAKADTGVLFYFSPPPSPCCNYLPPSSPPPSLPVDRGDFPFEILIPVSMFCAFCGVINYLLQCMRRGRIDVRVERIEGDLLQHLGAGIIRLISVDWLLSQPPDWIAVRRQVRRAALQLYALRRARLTSTLVGLLVFEDPNSSSLGRNYRRKPF